MALDPRQVAKVLGLFVTLIEPSEQAEDLGGALGAHRGIGGGEALGVKGGIGGRPAAHIKGGETHLEILGDVDACVLQQRNDVVGRRADHRILKIDEAYSLKALPVREPMQIRRMIVAQRPACRLGEDGRQELGQMARNCIRAPDGGVTRAIAGAYQSFTSSTSTSIASMS